MGDKWESTTAVDSRRPWCSPITSLSTARWFKQGGCRPDGPSGGHKRWI